MMNRRLKELEHECEVLNITVVPAGKKISRRDYVLALREHFLKIRFPDAMIPWCLRQVMAMESFMLCSRYDDQTPELQEALWSSPDYVAQEKINGIRMLVVYNAFEGIHFYSRNISVKDYLPVEYKNINLPNLDLLKLSTLGIDSFVLDTEVLCPEAKINTAISRLSSGGVITETNLAATSAILALNDEDSLRLQRENGIVLQFHAFHLLELNYEDYKEVPFDRMEEKLRSLVDTLQAVGLSVVKVSSKQTDRLSYFERILADGGEGVVFKHINSTYIPTESRSHRQWIKCKRTVSGSLSDTVDGWISGFVPGGLDTSNEHLVGALKVSVFVRDGEKEVEHEIARVSNLTLEQRKEMTILEADGNPTLRFEFYNRVVEIDGQWVSARNKRFMHAKLVRFRDDRSKDSCCLDKHLLEKMVI